MGGKKPNFNANDFGDAYVPPTNSDPKEYEQAAPTNTTPCPDCGRKFNDKAMEKHIKICAKVFG